MADTAVERSYHGGAEVLSLKGVGAVCVEGSDLGPDLIVGYGWAFRIYVVDGRNGIAFHFGVESGDYKRVNKLLECADCLFSEVFREALADSLEEDEGSLVKPDLIYSFEHLTVIHRC